jgi:beta-phosphoglucomutase-like phosphatase (HAD superfamily)
MVKAQAVLFDMDGVVIDTRQSIVDFWQALAVERGVLLTDADYDQHIHGVPAVQTLQALFPSMTPEQTSELMERMLRYERGLRYTEIVGMTAFLRRLSGAGVRTGLVTSGMGWKVDAVVEQLGLGSLFDVIVTASDIERGKPDPDCYLTAARKLGVAGSECVVFEDAISGVRAAVALVRCAWASKRVAWSAFSWRQEPDTSSRILPAWTWRWSLPPLRCGWRTRSRSSLQGDSACQGFLTDRGDSGSGHCR